MRVHRQTQVIGRAAVRLPNTACMCFEGVLGNRLVAALSEMGVYASSGAACTAGAVEPSHVLRAMGVAVDVARGQMRFSLGRFDSGADVDRLLELLPRALEAAKANAAACGV